MSRRKRREFRREHISPLASRTKEIINNDKGRQFPEFVDELSGLRIDPANIEMISREEHEARHRSKVSVSHPSHYTRGNIEVADFIEDQKLDWQKGNAVKYICRAGFKDPAKEEEDIEKAIEYLCRELKVIRKRNLEHYFKMPNPTGIKRHPEYAYVKSTYEK